MFENEKKKLREEEEKSFDDSIGNWFRICALAYTRSNDPWGTNDLLGK